MDDWSVIKIEVKNKAAKFRFNIKLTYEVSFNGEIGNIYGLMPQSKESGEFDYIKLYDQNHQLDIDNFD
jgi:hypothetical protein